MTLIQLECIVLIDSQDWWNSIEEQEKIKIIREREKATPEIIRDKIFELMDTKWTSSDKERFRRYVNTIIWN